MSRSCTNIQTFLSIVFPDVIVLVREEIIFASSVELFQEYPEEVECKLYDNADPIKPVFFERDKYRL
jgi:hypothetical protein